MQVGEKAKKLLFWARAPRAVRYEEETDGFGGFFGFFRIELPDFPEYALFRALKGGFFGEHLLTPWFIAPEGARFEELEALAIPLARFLGVSKREGEEAEAALEEIAAV